ncbi:uncharacterized protein LOC117330056 [Pecten maximus]|uniref:uncharacterized protein LOC117330056 n=1 Tax=Pecten maximus TaxID=6579 RepID=UPI0014580C9D|nr:uncharacterized protein LOC117330056 [Pecten maximus]
MSDMSSSSDSDSELNNSDLNLGFTSGEEGPPDDTSGETTVTLLVDGVLIRVVKGNIAKETVDVIVNSTSTDLDLTKGTASKVLLKEAGDSLQTECRQSYPEGITVGDLAVTGAGNLSCDYIYHGSLVKWGTNNAAQVHIDFVTKCLQTASDNDLESIAIPGLTTGFLTFPKDIAAKNACECIRKFVKSNQDTSLKDIRIVIYEKDKATLKAFSTEVKTWKDRIDQFVPVRDVCNSTVGGMTVRVVVDKMEDQKVDVIVNSANKELKLDKGTLSNTLNRVAGPALQQSCSTLYPNGIEPKDVAFTDAGNLSCKQVYHVCVCDFDQSNEDASSKVIIDLVSKCLDEMHSKGFTSIAFPALGTRYRKYPAKLSAKAMFEGFEKFWSSQNSSTISDVRIVIYGNDQHTIGKAFEKQATGAVTTVPRPQVSEFARGTKPYCLDMYEQSVHPPSYWSHFKSSKPVKKWKVSPPNGKLHCLVPVSQEEKKAVVDLIESTWEANKIGHGRDAVGLMGFTSLKVTNVQRLENIDLFEKYGNARAQLFHKAGSIGVFDHLETISGSKGAIKTANLIDPTLKRDTFPEVNEFYFFHGTKPDILESIMKQGLDIRMSGERAMFGQGMYLAESSTKADQYTDAKGNRNQDEKTMLLTRVCLGKICLLSRPANIKRPPCFIAGCNSDTCSHSDLERCDSVVGDGTWLFREFVLYSQHQSYPEYVITYTRLENVYPPSRSDHVVYQRHPSRFSRGTSGDTDENDDDEESPTAQRNVRRRRRHRFTMIGKLQATVIKGNIVEETADVIVNSTVKELRLDKGRASKSLLIAAGDKIQSECDNDYPRGISHGDLAVTSGGRLSCQKIYHVCLPKRTSTQDEKVMKSVLHKCLEKAHISNKTSIAFPALGTGFLGYSPDVVATTMFQCIQEFDKAHQSTTLKTIYIIVFYKEDNIFREFLSAAKSLAQTVSPGAAANSGPTQAKIGPINFEVVYGKMAEQKVDVVVNSTSKDLKLGGGSGLAKSLLTAAGPSLQTECDNSYPNGILPGDLAITGSYNLPCKKVFHGTFTSFYSKQTGYKRPEEVLFDFVQDCLSQANNNGYTSIAFPALGTGFLKYPKDTVASAIVGSIREYVQNHQTCLSDVKVIVFGQDWKDIEQAFRDELQGKKKIQRRVTSTIPARNTKEFLKYKYMETPHPPPYWTKYRNMKSVKEWTMDAKSSPALLQVDQQTCGFIENAFKKTGMASRTIIKIERLESIKLLENYLHMCQLLFRQAYVVSSFKEIQNITGSKGPVTTSKHLDKSMTQYLNHEINEAYLFHGTKSPFVKTITHQGLDNRLANAGRVGNGVYAAEVASKSNQYVDRDGQGYSYMFLVRMCLGDIFITKSGQNFRRPPCKACSTPVCTQHSEVFTSVVADGGGFSDREFVVYDQDLTYPEYLITYK